MPAAPIHADNAAQADYWNANAGHKWTEHQEHQDQVLRPVSDRLIAAAKPKPGERVIDVGCGCGATTIQFAERVGPAGAVLGLDVSAPMLARARERAPQGLPITSRSLTPRSTMWAPTARTYSCRGSASCSSPIRRNRSPICARASNPAAGSFRLLARGQAKSVLHLAAAGGRQACPAAARDQSRGSRPVRLCERSAGAAAPRRRRLRRHQPRTARPRARHRGRARTRNRRPRRDDDRADEPDPRWPERSGSGRSDRGYPQGSRGPCAGRKRAARRGDLDRHGDEPGLTRRAPGSGASARRCAASRRSE